MTPTVVNTIPVTPTGAEPKCTKHEVGTALGNLKEGVASLLKLTNTALKMAAQQKVLSAAQIKKFRAKAESLSQAAQKSLNAIPTTIFECSSCAQVQLTPKIDEFLAAAQKLSNLALDVTRPLVKLKLKKAAAIRASAK